MENYKNIPEELKKHLEGMPEEAREMFLKSYMSENKEEELVVKDETPEDFSKEMEKEFESSIMKKPEGESISETFDNLTSKKSVEDLELNSIKEREKEHEEVKQKEEQEQPVKKEKPKAKIKEISILDDIFKDLDIEDVDIVDKSPLAQQKDLKLLEPKGTFQVVALQSCYVAHMTSLNMEDINSLTSTSADLYNQYKKQYRIIHSRMKEMSAVENIGFNDWLKVTSFLDLETLYYGVYCQTFPDENKFDITCGSCDKKTPVVVNNNSLVQIKSDKNELFERMDEVLKSINSIDDLLKNSVLSKKKRVILPNTKLLIDLKIPSLWDQLELIRTTDVNVLQEKEVTMGTILFVKDMYVLDVEKTRRTGKPSYSKLNNMRSKLSALSKLSITDGKELMKGIREFSEKYEISYEIHNAKCTHCNDTIGDIPLDMERVLFTQIGRLQRMEEN